MFRTCRMFWTCVVGLVCGCAASLHATEAITSIRVEQGCTACETSSLVLSRDGAATLTITGNARLGGVDRVSRGRIAGAAFDRLAALVEAQGFERLSDSYEDPDIRDGAWQATTVTRGAREKKVFSRDEAGPAPLRRINAALAEARGAIRFGP